MERLDTTAVVDTPERVPIRYRIAGPGRRAAAYAVDGVLRGIALVGVAGVGMALAPIPGLDGVGLGAFLLVTFALEWGYGVAFEWLLGGRTPGKLLFRLRVVRDDGAPGRLPDFVLRNLLRAADFLPAFFAVGLGSMWIDRRFRRLGDLVAGTVVVVEDRERMQGRVRVEPPVSDEERRGLPPRVVLGTEEIRVLEQFLRRLPALTPERAEELAGLYGPALRARTGIEAPTWTRTLVLAYARATGRDR